MNYIYHSDKCVNLYLSFQKRLWYLHQCQFYDTNLLLLAVDIFVDFLTDLKIVAFQTQLIVMLIAQHRHLLEIVIY